MKIVDGDSHFIEPLDLFTRYMEPAYRERAMRVVNDPTTGKQHMIVDGKPMRLGSDTEEMLSIIVGHGQKEEGNALNEFDRSLIASADWQDMGKRVQYLDTEGLDYQILFPTLGLLWEGEIRDAGLAAAHCRAYNTWAFEVCAGRLDRLFPAAHISLRDPALAVEEMQRIAKFGGHSVMIGSAPVHGKSFGQPDYDPIWATAQDLNLAVTIHPAGNKDYLGSAWFRHRNPGFMFISMNVIQDPRMSLSTMVYDGVFERFPALRVATVESMGSWVGEWIERFEYRYQYMRHTSQMKRPIREYFARNIWVNADPSEKLLPLIVQFVGDEKFFVGSDYPHAEGFAHPIEAMRNVLVSLPASSVERILGTNACAFYGLAV
ncbi:MAG: amidohydrolase [Deltaproteobacteria bacterium]|nr:amidohydrolase [Deltaproteobacteria bacterium]